MRAAEKYQTKQTALKQPPNNNALPSLRSVMFRKIFSCLSLIYRRQFFLLIQSVCAALVPSQIFSVKKSVFYRLDRKEQSLFRDVKEIEVFSGTETSVREIVDDLYEGKAVTLNFYEEFYRNGIEPCLARSNGKIVGVIWLFTGSYLTNWEGYDAWLLNISIEPTAKFVANVFVLPEYRGRGIFAIIAERCFAAYPESPFYSCVDETNIVSIKSHEKIGFRRCGNAYYIRFFQRTYCFFVPKKGRWRLIKLSRGVAADVSLRTWL